jgi:diadenosine tetraphosphate (Ap4A) HIT family hydrolase
MKDATMPTPICPFCRPEPERIVVQNALALAMRDTYPLTPGHTLIVPRRHVASWLAASPEERAAITELIAEVEQQLTDELHPDGYNVGINDGQAAGQTIMHLHLHVIPRRRGDCPDPRGGIRWILPKRADYWSEREAT